MRSNAHWFFYFREFSIFGFSLSLVIVHLPWLSFISNLTLQCSILAGFVFLVFSSIAANTYLS